jgi:hypothetical protein
MQMAGELQVRAKSRSLIFRVLGERAPVAAGRVLGAVAGAILGAIAFAQPAAAQSCSAYTYSLTNGTTADATQVMSNFNTIMTCANSNLAHNGANSDITSLSAATSINGLTISASTGTLTIANSKTASFSNTLTLTGTDGTTMNFPSTSATIARTDAGNTFTGSNLGANTGGWELVDTAASATVPTLIPNQTDATTGWGAQASGNISGVIAGAEEFRLTPTGINNAPIGQTTPAAASFTSLQSTSISGSTQCVHADASGNLTGTGVDCGSSGFLTSDPHSFTAAQRETPSTLSLSGATATPDFDASNNFTLTLTHASCPCTLANPSTTPVAGQSGIIEIIQSSSGADTITTWGSDFTTTSGVSAIALSTAANARDYFSYYVDDSTHIVVSPAILNATH